MKRRARFGACVRSWLLHLLTKCLHLTQAKLCSAATLREAVLTGRKYSSRDALAAGLIDRECSVEELAADAEQLATAMLPTNLKLLRFDATALQMMKIELYTDAYRALTMGTSATLPSSRL